MSRAVKNNFYDRGRQRAIDALLGADTDGDAYDYQTGAMTSVFHPDSETQLNVRATLAHSAILAVGFYCMSERQSKFENRTLNTQKEHYLTADLDLHPTHITHQSWSIMCNAHLCVGIRCKHRLP